MGLRYENLDEKTRALMVSEIEAGGLYLSSRLNGAGCLRWPILLKEAARWHDDDWLARQLIAQRLMSDREMLISRTGRLTWRSNNIEVYAAALAEREFNRYYLRALCVKATQRGIRQLEICRGKQVLELTPELEARIGGTIDAAALLDTLRRQNASSIEQSAGPVPGGLLEFGLTARLPQAGILRAAPG